MRTDIKFDAPGVDVGFIPQTLMFDIGKAYEQYREGVMMSKRQMHDLSAMVPLRPATIRRKQGIHKVRNPGRKALKGKAAWHSLARGGLKVSREHKGYASQFPDVPLVDTGNLLRSPVGAITVGPGYLSIGLGPQRLAIGTFHQVGNPKLPRRIHHSWNEEFWKTRALPIISHWFDLAIRRML